MFSAEFRQRLSIAEYTRWASSLTVDELEALLWMVGEFFSRCGPVIALLKRHSEEVASRDNGSRAYHALWALLGADWKDSNQALTSGFLFSYEFRQRLRLGKHTAWAANLTEVQLEAILSILGDFSQHAKPLLELLDEHAKEIQFKYQFVRSRYALEAIEGIVGGDRYDLAEAIRRVRQRLVESGSD